MPEHRALHGQVIDITQGHITCRGDRHQACELVGGRVKDDVVDRIQLGRAGDTECTAVGHAGCLQHQMARHTGRGQVQSHGVAQLRIASGRGQRDRTGEGVGIAQGHTGGCDRTRTADTHRFVRALGQGAGGHQVQIAPGGEGVQAHGCAAQGHVARAGHHAQTQGARRGQAQGLVGAHRVAAERQGVNVGDVDVGGIQHGEPAIHVVARVVERDVLTPSVEGGLPSHHDRGGATVGQTRGCVNPIAADGQCPQGGRTDAVDRQIPRHRASQVQGVDVIERGISHARHTEQTTEVVAGVVQNDVGAGARRQCGRARDLHRPAVGQALRTDVEIAADHRGTQVQGIQIDQAHVGGPHDADCPTEIVGSVRQGDVGTHPGTQAARASHHHSSAGANGTPRRHGQVAGQGEAVKGQVVDVVDGEVACGCRNRAMEIVRRCQHHILPRGVDGQIAHHHPAVAVVELATRVERHVVADGGRYQMEIRHRCHDHVLAMLDAHVAGQFVGIGERDVAAQVCPLAAHIERQVARNLHRFAGGGGLGQGRIGEDVHVARGHKLAQIQGVVIGQRDIVRVEHRQTTTKVVEAGAGDCVVQDQVVATHVEQAGAVYTQGVAGALNHITAAGDAQVG